MYKQEVIILNNDGLHARPASMLVKTASSFKSDVKIEHDGKSFNAKSIISVLSAGITAGNIIDVIADGTDERQAVEIITELINNKFDLN